MAYFVIVWRQILYSNSEFLNLFLHYSIFDGIFEDDSESNFILVLVYKDISLWYLSPGRFHSGIQLQGNVTRYIFYHYH